MTSYAEPAPNLSYFQHWHQSRLNYQILNLPPMVVACWPGTWSNLIWFDLRSYHPWFDVRSNNIKSYQIGLAPPVTTTAHRPPPIDSSNIPPNAATINTADCTTVPASLEKSKRTVFHECRRCNCCQSINCCLQECDLRRSSKGKGIQATHVWVVQVVDQQTEPS